MSTFYRTFREQNTKNHSTGEEEFFCAPDPATTRSLKPYNYGKLQACGFVPEDTHVQPGDVIIGKCMPQKAGQTIGNKCTSVALKSNERGFVDCNCHGHRHFTNVTGDGYTFAKVRLRQERVPTIGDKVSCYTADHDVLTEAHGWVPVAEVDARVHRVASLLDDGRLCYQAPAAVQRYRYHGPLVSVKGDGADLLVTPEHRLWCSADADVLEFGTRLAGDVAASGGGGEEEGGVHFLKVLPECEDAPAGREDEALHGMSVRLMDATGHWIAEASLGGSETIALPRWMCRRPTHDRDHVRLRALLSSLVPGDGGLPTRSRVLADQVQQIALHVGTCCDVEPDGGRLGWVRVQLLSDTVLKTMPVVRASLVEADEAGRDVSVHCCTVPLGPGIIYVRRNGRGVWCGNSRHGQKGTIGQMYNEQDMPFTSSGIIPSLIINPHAIPSRMTIGQLMEALECKAGGFSGAMGDATPFNNRSVEDIAAELEAMGAERYGNEIMYNPRSGEQVACSVFVCPTYYQRLKHMVEDKVHSRAANGPVVLLTRQPAEGRARDGGLRLGEMELECLWAHGSMYFLKVGGRRPPRPPRWAEAGEVRGGQGRSGEVRGGQGRSGEAMNAMNAMSGGSKGGLPPL